MVCRGVDAPSCGEVLRSNGGLYTRFCIVQRRAYRRTRGGGHTACALLLTLTILSSLTVCHWQTGAGYVVACLNVNGPGFLRALAVSDEPTQRDVCTAHPRVSYVVRRSTCERPEAFLVAGVIGCLLQYKPGALPSLLPVVFPCTVLFVLQ